MTRAKNDYQDKYLQKKKKVSVELNFEQIDGLLKAHLASFDRAYYEQSPLTESFAYKNASRFAEYVNTTSTLIHALASHPADKEYNS